ncbi:MAG: tetrahydrofolate dehydrogenase/cyclohydrolase catalytic domain-containing protein [Deinococcales bacterium]
MKAKPVVAAIKADLSDKIASLPFKPSVHFVRVGEDPASVVYVKSKETTAKEIGMDAYTHVLPEDSSESSLLAFIDQLNQDDRVDGILVQLPLPKQIDADKVLLAIDPLKDVDGLHPLNVGRLWVGQDAPLPCTPAGLIKILDFHNIDIQGKKVLIIGRSNIVGKPAAALFLRRHATVTIAHSRSRDLPSLCREADILVAAIGQAGFVKPDMVKPGAVLLDVGVSRIDGKIFGDIDPQAAEVASYLTPMPGGTGPMTVAMLMENSYQAALQRRKYVP